MSVILKSVEDPRDNLEKAGKYELWQFAVANGLNDVTYDTPSILVRKKLRALGLVNINIPDRPLGSPIPTVYGADPQKAVAPVKQSTEVNEISAEDLLEMEAQVKPVAQMSMTELRSECKRRGIKMVRTDNLRTLREKLG